ncbi:MAG: hypothetical protein N2515_04560, partial [Deltaproteobacteria bacterium]|nr:hypothetical protein [Deltaproteobacteria bacterium]
AQRRQYRGKQGLYDADDFQVIVGEMYRKLQEWLPEERIVYVDSSQPEEEVARSVLDVVLGVIEEKRKVASQDL